ncbi:MAG TPA: LPXTG cell wall anchor domain-containing protein, partial [Euryarchaeota archaeon]|nr:LPXTG cell wall anchor domain-containing protein [Euryarchaeota archaeon]
TNLLYIILGAVALLIVLAALLLSRRGEREAEE